MNSMTHYMALVMGNQPWNLIIFSALPIIFAETLTITEFVTLFNRKGNSAALGEVAVAMGPSQSFNKQNNSIARKINKFVGIVGGLYFTVIFAYLFTAVAIPLTMSGQWNTWVDVIAVGFYLSRVLFLLPIALMDLGLIFKNKSEEEKMQIHFKLVVGFLIVAHINMIFGMLNPDVVRMAPSMGNMKM